MRLPGLYVSVNGDLKPLESDLQKGRELGIKYGDQIGEAISTHVGQKAAEGASGLAKAYGKYSEETAKALERMKAQTDQFHEDQKSTILRNAGIIAGAVAIAYGVTHRDEIKAAYADVSAQAGLLAQQAKDQAVTIYGEARSFIAEQAQIVGEKIQGFIGEELFNAGSRAVLTAARDKLADLGKAAIDTGANLYALSLMSGQSAQALGQMQDIAARSGVSFDTLQKAFQSLEGAQKGMTDEGQLAAHQLELIGVSLVDAEGKTKPVNTVFLDTVKALSQLSASGQDASQKLGVINNIFGSSNKDLVMGLAQGFEAWDARLQQASNSSLQFSDGFSRSAQIIKDEQRELEVDQRQLSMEWSKNWAELGIAFDTALGKNMSSMGLWKQAFADTMETASKSWDWLIKKMASTVLGKLGMSVTGLDVLAAAFGTETKTNAALQSFHGAAAPTQSPSAVKVDSFTDDDLSKSFTGLPRSAEDRLNSAWATGLAQIAKINKLKNLSPEDSERASQAIQGIWGGITEAQHQFDSRGGQGPKAKSYSDIIERLDNEIAAIKARIGGDTLAAKFGQIDAHSATERKQINKDFEDARISVEEYQAALQKVGEKNFWEKEAAKLDKYLSDLRDTSSYLSSMAGMAQGDEDEAKRYAAWAKMEEEVTRYQGDQERATRAISEYETRIEQIGKERAKTNAADAVTMAQLTGNRQAELDATVQLLQAELSLATTASQRAVLEEKIRQAKEVAGGDPFDAAARGARDYYTTLPTLFEGVAKSVSDSFKQMEDALTDWITGLLTGQKAALSFADVAKSALSSAVRGVVQNTVTGPISQAISGLTGMGSSQGQPSTGGLYGAVGSLFSSVKGLFSTGAPLTGEAFSTAAKALDGSVGGFEAMEAATGAAAQAGGLFGLSSALPWIGGIATLGGLAASLFGGDLFGGGKTTVSAANQAGGMSIGGAWVPQSYNVLRSPGGSHSVQWNAPDLGAMMQAMQAQNAYYASIDAAGARWGINADAGRNAGMTPPVPDIIAGVVQQIVKDNIEHGILGDNYDAVQSVRKSGEGLDAVLSRLGQTMDAVRKGADFAGVSMRQLSGGLDGLKLAVYDQKIADIMGGADKVASALQRFVSYAYNAVDGALRRLTMTGASAGEGLVYLRARGVGIDNFWESYRQAMDGSMSPDDFKRWSDAAEGMASFQDAISNYISTVTSNTQTLIDSAKSYAESFARLKNKLIASSETSTLNSGDRYLYTQAVFRDVTARAATGDAAALAGVESAATDYLGAAKEALADYSLYQRTFNEVVSVVDTLEAYEQAASASGAAQLSVLNEQLTALTGVKTATSVTIPEALANIKSAIDGARTSAANAVVPKAASSAPAQDNTAFVMMAMMMAMPHADGGVFDQPHLGLVAEAGPEAIIPMKRGSIPVEMRGGGQAALIAEIKSLRAEVSNMRGELAGAQFQLVTYARRADNRESDYYANGVPITNVTGTALNTKAT